MKTTKLKIALVLICVWPLIELGDGVLTYYNAVMTGKELCANFLGGYNNQPDHEGRNYRMAMGGSWLRTIYRDTHWITKEEKFDTCRFAFYWRDRHIFRGSLHFWLTKFDKDKGSKTVFTGAHVNYLYVYNRINISGGVVSDQPELFVDKYPWWEETIERKSVLDKARN